MNEDKLWIAIFMNAVIGEFADKPELALSRFPKEISLPDDLVGDLIRWDESLRESCNKYKNSKVGKLVAVISDEITTEGRDSSFWTNEGFKSHEKWKLIRAMCRKYVLGNFGY